MTRLDPSDPQPLDLSDVDLAFPARALNWMPPHDQTPAADEWALRFFGQAIHGTFVEDVSLIPADGVDAEAAWRTITAISGSFAPKHEHKEAVVAWLLSTWFVGAVGTRHGERVAYGDWPTNLAVPADLA